MTTTPDRLKLARDALAPLPKPCAWITNESAGRLKDGGNRKGSVPVHSKPSATAKNALFVGAQMQAMYEAGFSAAIDALPASVPAAPAPAALLTGWRIEAMSPDGYAVHAPSGAACIVRESDDSPRIVPTVVLADLCRDLLATVAVPAVAAPEPLTVTRTAPGFRWDGKQQQHVPNLLIEFEPVPANGTCDAKGWRDRDALAGALKCTAPTTKEPQ